MRKKIEQPDFQETTNFKTFLSWIRDDLEEFEPHYLCVATITAGDFGSIKSEEKEEMHEVKRKIVLVHSITYGNFKLKLWSEVAKKAFILEVENELMDGMDYNTWYSIEKEKEEGRKTVLFGL